MTVYRDRENPDVFTAISERAARRTIARQFKRAERRTGWNDFDRFGSFSLDDRVGSIVVYEFDNADTWVSGVPRAVER